MEDPNNSTYADDRETVELFFSCRSLANMDIIGKSDPVIYLKKHVTGHNYAEVGRTEVIRNDLNPDFARSFNLEFIFETKQKFKVEVIDVDNFNTLDGDYIGSAEFELADIIGSMHNMKILRLMDKKGNETGKCIVRLDKVKEENKKLITIKMGVNNIPKTSFFANHNSFVKIYKLRLTEAVLERIKDQDTDYSKLPVNEWLLVYKSKAIKGKDISLAPINMKSSKLCNNNFDIPLRVELWKYKSNGNHKNLGHLFITLNELVSRMWKKPFSDHGKSTTAQLEVTDFKAVESFDFTDYLRGGLNITLLVGIDFTASNRDPDDPKSLHFLNPPQLNLYQQSILAVGEVLQKYNHSKQIPSYGFGAKINGEPKATHFFPINMNYMDPCVSSFNELFKIYHETTQKILFSGPTYFRHIFKEVIDFTQRRFEQDQNNYSVFLLLTDGCVNDMQETIDEIVRGCYQPLSIIIVGIGNENFGKMEILDADDVPLISSWGEKMKRDIVQFVPFNKYKNNPLILREEVLDELPAQVTSFFAMKGMKPQEAKIINPQQFNLSRGNTMQYNNQYADLMLNNDEQNYPSIDN